MKFISIILILIAVALGALFYIKHSDALLLSAIGVLIVGFWLAVFTIAKEPES
ncbi:hypothetical protein [Sulfurimonas sp.]